MATPVSFLPGGAGATTINNICNASIETPYFAIIVGAGLSGAVLAEQLAREGRRILVLDKRDHIGGNVYDEIEPESGLRVAKYGAHIFHTNDEGVWAYVNRFGRWKRWDHRVLARVGDRCVGDRFVPIPANINTVNALFDANIASEEGMREWMVGERQGSEAEAMNSEQVALARVGPRLYRALFETYTLKQWGVPASALDPLVLQRIPVRDNFDDRYFGDKYQALPIEGYTALVTSLLAHPAIEVRTGVDFFADREKWEAAAKWVLYTGPVDSFFPLAGLARLEYRSILFEKKVIDCVGYVQPCAQLNYADDTTPFTRSVEFKHFLHKRAQRIRL
jgi:UDP-galactopyranose mutase